MLMQVQQAASAELSGLMTLRSEAGELSAADERKLRSLQRSTEREILQVPTHTANRQSDTAR